MMGNSVLMKIAAVGILCVNPGGICRAGGGQTLPHETSLEESLACWPRMGQQVTFIGLKHCPTKFQIYWNGAISCFVGRDCFGQVFPPQRDLGQEFEADQLHLTFGYGRTPCFQIIDKGQVEQSLEQGFLPIVRTAWPADGLSYSVQSFATSLVPEELGKQPPGPICLCLSRIVITAPQDSGDKEAHLWLNFSGYRCFIATDKEKPDDAFGPYGRTLALEGTQLRDSNGRIRAAVRAGPGTKMEFLPQYPAGENPDGDLERARKKGFLNNLLHLTIPFDEDRRAAVEIALPYFPVPPEQAGCLDRDFDRELDRVIRYWQELYEPGAVLETPEPFVNNLYKAGLHHTLITADADAATGKVYAKTSPGWYETIWPNCAMVTAVSMDRRGYPGEAERYLEPFLDWQGVCDPPGMNRALRKGFFCPPKEYCAIGWVSNHGSILWAICEHYRLSQDAAWKARITEPVLEACDWIIQHRARTRENQFGRGLLPAGTVSDDRGSGQYLGTDAYNYRGLRGAADFLKSIGHRRAKEMDLAAMAYRRDIREAVRTAAQRNEPVALEDGRQIPFVPAEINQERPPRFDMDDFWPYINYTDVGPMHLIDSGVFEGDSDVMRWILQFEEQYPVARLRNEISVTENWCHSIRYPGDRPAYLLRHGVSVIEPFYSPRATAFLDNDESERYLEVFYHQMASAVSQSTLTPVENRHGVWHLPWADGEFHTMLLRMLVYEQDDTLFLLRAIPRRWLEAGKEIHVQKQPTSFGVVGFAVSSELQEDRIEMNLRPPQQAAPKKIIIRFRHPDKKQIKEVIRNGKPWGYFEGDQVVLYPSYAKAIRLKVYF